MALPSLSQFPSWVFIDVGYHLARERFAPINHRKWLRNINIYLRCRPVIEFAVNRACKLYIAERRSMSHMGHSRQRWSRPRFLHVRFAPIATVSHQNVIRRYGPR